MNLIEMGMGAKKAAAYLNKLGVSRKNEGLSVAAKALLNGAEEILEANQKDMDCAKRME